MATAAAALAPAHPAIANPWLQTGPNRLTRLVADVCPGPASEHEDTWLGQVGKSDGSGQHPALWRIGAAQLPGHPGIAWPVAVPLLDDAHLQITTTNSTRATAEHMVESLLMRVLSTFRPGLVRVHLWDARQMAGSLPGLYPLMDEGLFTPHDPTQLDGLLDLLRERCATVVSRALTHGHRSLRDQAHADSDGVRSEPWTIAVLLGDGHIPPNGAHAALQRVARNALPAGVSLIVVDIPVTLAGHTTQVVLDGPANRCSMTGPRVRLIPDLPIPARRLSSAAAAIAAWYADWRVREATFRDLLPADYGSCTSTDSVAAPLGFSESGAPVIAELGDATPHALVGGPSGTGKTNVLLGWLMAMCARYAPSELALYLLDFKDGVSFAPLAGGPTGECWLPHAKLVGVNINDDREFGVALLRHLAAELRSRATAAKRVGATKLAELRRADPDGHWPRIVAVIDECQVLLQSDDAVTDEALQILEDLARRGRALGIHLVLASQNLSDVRALWTRAAILEQFTLRIGLPRARGVFADQNHALKGLPRFHAIVNTEGGEEHGNITARVPNACTPGTADHAQAEMFERWGDPGNRPILLDGAVRPVARDLWTVAAAPHVTVGRGFTVDGAPATARLDARPGRNLAVLGVGADQEAARVLSCAAAGLAGQGVALDLVTFDALGEAHADWVATHAPDVRRVTASGFSAHLDALAAEISARNNGATRPPRAVTIWQVDAIESRFDADDIELLKTLLHHGPEVGVHFLGWWRSVARLLSLLYTGAAGTEDIGIWAVCDVVGSEIGSEMPGLVANGWEPRENRGFLYDRDRAAAGRQLFMIPTLEGGNSCDTAATERPATGTCNARTRSMTRPLIASTSSPSVPRPSSSA